MVFAVLSFGAAIALFVSFCILVIGFVVHLLLVHFSVKRKVLSAYRFLVVMVLLAPVFLMYDGFGGGRRDGFFSVVVTGYLITAVIISFLGRIIEYYNSEERE
ncbi:hypothetical protein HMPREF3170_00035 [Corynebacterium sp. HMSC08D02]|nr:hypothetical protein HMPREF3170_00035 [Corynebacterium sp. HMSC08D02]